MLAPHTAGGVVVVVPGVVGWNVSAAIGTFVSSSQSGSIIEEAFEALYRGIVQ